MGYTKRLLQKALKQLREDPDGDTLLTVSTSGDGGIAIDDGSATRSFVTAGVVNGVPTGNFT